MVQTVFIIITFLSCLIWLYLIVLHGWFWLADEVLKEGEWPQDAEWPEVVVIIPARNEEKSIGSVTRSHLASDYPGRLSLIVVDDQSDDGTKKIVSDLARDASRPVHVVSGQKLPDGWSGKLWAVHTGFKAAADISPAASYVLLTDADIAHAPGVLRKLVGKAEREGCVLVSIMAHLDARGFWGGLLMPAFIFFFQKLYPFRSTNDVTSVIAGAAGGCMLINRETLNVIGGVETIRGNLIDDCALAFALKDPKGAKRSIWLGFDKGVVSLRDNRALSTIWKMVARTAFTQLKSSSVALTGAVIGMILTYAIGPIAVFTLPYHGATSIFIMGTAAWLMAMIAYCPTLIRYEKSLLWALLLPVSAIFYLAMTIASALNHWRGKGGAWKGRTYS